MYRQMGSKFGSRFHGIVSDYFIAAAIVADADYRSVLHREFSQVTHPSVSSLAEKPAAFQVREFLRHRHDRSYRRKRFQFIINVFGNIDNNVSAVALGPSLFPEITGDFRYLFNFAPQFRATIQY